MSEASAQHTILVVEDDGAVRNLVTTALEMHGYHLDVAVTGEAAVLAAASHHPDLIMLDLGLPDIDGVDVIEKVRGWSAVPIIVISARAEDADKIRALDAGADDYLTKPFSVDELLARVRASLRRSQLAGGGAADESVFENGPLRIDYAAGCAYLGGEQLGLTPTEYKLLALLARNAGKVLTHTFITREIWGTSWDSDIASLRVFMRTLRKKIEADPAHPQLIQTHVGVGYRMQRL
ncbi:MAG: response regulator transcription factor [Coriobacteriaceae bacterium]|nr:response regulator transcription factor [Coriobacteriaceae bacterium]